jgi:hypothetical protein
MKKMLVLFLGSALFIGCNNDAEKKSDTAPAAATATTMQDAEFADAKYVEIGKKGIAALSAGDVAGWMNGYAGSVCMEQWRQCCRKNCDNCILAKKKDRSN